MLSFPGLKFILPQAMGPIGPSAQPSDGRSYYNGGLMGGAATDPTSGQQLGSQYTDPNGNTYGAIPYGGMSQFAGIPNQNYSGYAGGPDPTAPGPWSATGNYTPPAWNIDPATAWGVRGVGAPDPQAQNPAPGLPKPHEVPQGRQPMMGQWGGGAYNVGSGAPASMQQMWLGSTNGGQSWAQAPSYNASAPQPGQASRGSWQQTPNQDADSPTWMQR